MFAGTIEAPQFPLCKSFEDAMGYLKDLVEEDLITSSLWWIHLIG